MKCNVCGQEFGDGAYCQHCNADRITASGNYSGGYNAPAVSREALGADGAKTVGSAQKTRDDSGGVDFGKSESIGSKTFDNKNTAMKSEEKYIVCYNCANVIPADSEFCPCCGNKLFVICPKCGHKYSSQYKICNLCGTNKDFYLEECRKQLEEQNRLEQQRRQEEILRKEEERRREEASRPKIEYFKYSKSGDNLSIYISWSTTNYLECRLLMRDKAKDLWHYPVGQTVPLCGSVQVTTQRILGCDLASNLFKSEYAIVFRLEARKRDGDYDYREFEINVHSPLFGYAEIW